MRAVLSFLTRIPVKSTDIEDAAKQAYLFPVTGVIIGLITYIVGYGSFRIFPAEVGALFTILSLYLVTGLVHLDGLSDFSDGIMASGSRQQKISAMKDVKVGIGGIFSTIFVLMTSFYVISYLGEIESGKTVLGHTVSSYGFGCALVTSEVSAKLSMNTCIMMGREIPGGVGSLFIKHATILHYGAAWVISTFVGVVLVQLYFLVVYTGVIVAVVTVQVAHKNFGGVNGDVIGASNEISRVVTLLVWAVVL